MAVGDAVTGKLEYVRSASGTTFASVFRPSVGVEVVLTFLVTETIGTTVSATNSITTDAELYDGSDRFRLTSTTRTSAGSTISTYPHGFKIFLTNSIYLRMFSTASSGSPSGTHRLWYSGIQTAE